MKQLIFILSLFSVQLSQGQEKIIKKPEYVIIANDEFITREKVDEYAKNGYVKSITKGVSEEERTKLLKKFGDRIGDKEFIVIISLFTEEEKQARKKGKHEYIVEKADTQYDDKPTINVNDSIRDFAVKMIDGTTIKLSDLKGKVTLINFWATWCAPCLMEFYEFPSMIIEPFKDSTFVLLPISRGETEEKVKNKMNQLKQNGVDFNVGIDPNQTIASLYGAKHAIPKNVLIDKNGIIRYISTGYSEDNLKKISARIKKLLVE